MNIDYLREFIVCAQVKNFTKAANQLFITQSSLSKHITILENELGTDLFIRTNPLSLSSAGDYLFTRLETLLLEYDTIIRNTEAIGKGYSGNIGIGMLYYTKEVIMPVVSRFTQSYPTIKMNYLCSTPNEIVNAVLNRILDVACVQRLDFRNKNALQFYDLYDEPFVLIVSPKHPLAAKSYVSISEVKTEKYINVTDDFYEAYLKYINDRIQKYGVELQPTYLVPNFEEFLLAIELNRGFGIVPQALKRVDLGLKYVDLMEKDLFFKRSLLFLKDNMNSSLSLFLGSLEKVDPLNLTLTAYTLAEQP